MFYLRSCFPYVSEQLSDCDAERTELNTTLRNILLDPGVQDLECTPYLAFCKVVAQNGPPFQGGLLGPIIQGLFKGGYRVRTPKVPIMNPIKGLFKGVTG